MNPIIRNSIAMGLLNVFGRASGFLRYLILIAFLSPADFALITYGFAVGRVARHFMDGGLDYLLAREGAREQSRIAPYYINSLMLKLLLGLVFFLAGYLYLALFQSLSVSALLVIYTSMLGSAFLSLSGITRSGFAALERMEYILYANIPARFLSVTLLLVGLWLGMPVWGAAATVALEGILWFVLLLWMLCRFLPMSPSALSVQTSVTLVRKSWPLALYSFFNVLYLNLDVIMIQALMGSMDAVAPYTYASHFIEGLGILLGSYLAAAYPAFSRLYTTNIDGFRKLFRQSLYVLLLATLPVSVLLGIWADRAFLLLGIDDPVTVVVMRLLSVTLLFSVINTLLIVLFMAGDRTRWLIGFTGAGVLLALASNALLIPRFDQVGAAWATLITQVLVFISLSISVARVFRMRVAWVRIFSIIGCSLLAAVLPWALHLENFVVIFLVYTLIWGVVLVVFRPVEWDEILRIFRAARPSPESST